MANIWDKTIEVTPDMVQALLSSQFNLKAATIELLGQGFDNTAFLVNQQFVFRFPHKAQALNFMENEIMLLPYLAGKLPFPVPSPQFIGKPNNLYPFVFLGYPVLSGTLLTEKCKPLVDDINFAKRLGSWLAQLHALPILDEHRTNLKGVNDWRLSIEQRTGRVKATLIQYRNCFVSCGFDPEYLSELMDSFQTLDTTITKHCYLHADLYSKHILVDEQNLPVGFIDWGDMHIGHPALDIAVGLIIFTDKALQAFIDAYGKIDDATMDVARFKAYYHSVLALPYFVQAGETSSVQWVAAGLRNAVKLVENTLK